MEKPAGILEGAIYQVSPTWYAYYSGKALPQDAFASEVEKNQQNPNLGVKIKEFKPSATVYLENTPITLSGTIIASSLAEEIELQAYCSLKEYQDARLFPAQLTGNPTASGNKGKVFKDQTNAEFQVTCLFPPEAATTEKLRTPKTAKLTVTYEFTTKGTQKIYLLDKQELLALNGEDPFKAYKISDPQLSSARKIKSKTTDGPLSLSFGIDTPQPFTQDTVYRLSVQLANNVGWRGNLQKLDNIILQVPSAGDVEIVMDGESGFSMSGSPGCDFEYIGPGDEGYKLYNIVPEKLENVNKDCSKSTLTSLALSEKECISFLKERPTFNCFVKPLKVPENTLTYDTLRAEAKYIYKIEESSVLEIRQTLA